MCPALPSRRASASERTFIRIEDLAKRIGSDAITFTFTRSGGPGGQNVNKVSTRAVLAFDLMACLTLTDEQKITIRKRLGHRISGEGIFQVTSSRHRTQAANRAAATNRLFELLADALRPQKPRRPTKVPKSTKLRRLHEKQRKGEQKRLRSHPPLD